MLFLLVRNEITCKHCVDEALKLKFDKENEKTEPEQIIEKNYSKMYHQKSMKQKTHYDLNELKKSPNVKRDLVAQFFGPEI